MKPDSSETLGQLVLEDGARERPGDDSRKPFVRPRLERHESLPKVTNGFAGSFGP